MNTKVNNRNKSIQKVISGFIGFSAFVLFAQPVTAATFTVRSRADMPDILPGDGVCVANVNFFGKTYELCTLRAAIMEANAYPGADIINLRWATYRLDYHADGQYNVDESDGVVGDLDITDKLTINGVSKEKTIIDAEDLGERIFDIHDGSVVTLNNMTLKNGSALGDMFDDDAYNDLAMVFEQDLVEWSCPIREPADMAGGGGVLNRGGIVFVNQVRFEHNLAICDGGGADNILDGILWITESEFVENVAIANGGGIENDDDSILSVADSMFSLNNAYENGGALSADDSLTMVNGCNFTMNVAQHYGGAIWNGDSDAMLLRNVEVTFNEVPNTYMSDGGGIFNNDGFILFTGTNSIIWNSPNDYVDWNEPEGLPWVNDR